MRKFVGLLMVISFVFLLVGTAFAAEERDGQVLIEAETATIIAGVDKNGHPQTWERETGQSGDALRVPNLGFNWTNTAALAGNSPELRYEIQFNNAGTYHVWFLAQCSDGSSDSLHVGLNGEYQFTTMSFEQSDDFTWNQLGTLTIDQAGSYELNLWAREDGLGIDQIYLTNAELPPAPTGLSVVNKTMTPEPSVTLTWDEASTAAAYHVYRNAEAENGEYLHIGTTTAPEYTDDTVMLGMTYQYRVTQVNAIGIDSDQSAPVTVAIVDETISPPAAPGHLSLDHVSTNAIEFSWGAVGQALQYFIYRAESKEGPFERIGMSEEPSYTDLTALTIQDYYYRVAAVNEGGLSDLSPMLAYDASPSGLSVSNKSLLPEASVTLKWDELVQAHGYHVYKIAGGEQQAIRIGSTHVPEFTDDEVELGNTYQYQVTQYDAEHRESNLSEHLTVFMIDESVAAPDAPAAFALVNASETHFTFEWSSVKDAIHYSIYRGSSRDGSYEFVGKTERTTFTDKAPFVPAHYDYKVHAVNEGGLSASSNVVTTPITKSMIRPMENLGRGVVAVRDGSNAFISWRLLALDPSEIGFNVYRSEAGAEPVKLNDSVLTAGTNFTDTTVDLSQDNDYFVKPVINGVEQAASDSFRLPANPVDAPYFTIPLRDGGKIGNVWVGDFDGNGEYDYLVVRNTTIPQTLEAYKQDGTFLWWVDLGPNSHNQNNISPGSATVNVGHWDGVTVYDLNGDGKAEVILKIANGVTFGNGEVWTGENDTDQWIAVLDGETGKLLTSSPLPDDYISVGPLATQIGIGYLDGATPSVVVNAKNRNADGSFNMVISAYHMEEGELVREWKWLRDSQDLADGHQIRIVDIDEDGKDEIAHIGFVLNGDGTLRYALDGIVHGDRFHIGKLDPNRPGLQGYGIQQDHPGGLNEYYYDATTGTILWEHYGENRPGDDVGRGDVGDLDPRNPGYEVYSFYGIFNGPTETEISPEGHPQRPWPAFRFWWDEDLLSENLNHGKIEKWQYETKTLARLETPRNYENIVMSDRNNPLFYGDIFGDWREEAIYSNEDYNKLIIFTTPIPTEHRIYTLAQNPLYRSGMTIKGYMQSHLTDYYLGHDMAAPPMPNIYYTGNLMDVRLRISPETLNRKSDGNSITALIQMPADEAALVDLDTISMHVNGEVIEAQSSDSNNKHLMLKYDRQEVIHALAGIRGSVMISITGYLKDGRIIIGRDTIKVIH